MAVYFDDFEAEGSESSAHGFRVVAKVCGLGLAESVEVDNGDKVFQVMGGL